MVYYEVITHSSHAAQWNARQREEEECAHRNVWGDGGHDCLNYYIYTLIIIWAMWFYGPRKTPAHKDIIIGK